VTLRIEIKLQIFWNLNRYKMMNIEKIKNMSGLHLR
jgi:hypothetical protein